MRNQQARFRALAGQTHRPFDSICLRDEAAHPLKKGVSAAVLKRVFEYWRTFDKQVGDHIARGRNTDCAMLLHQLIGSMVRRNVKPQ